MLCRLKQIYDSVIEIFSVIVSQLDQAIIQNFQKLFLRNVSVLPIVKF